jgi:hypothetical protein
MLRHEWQILDNFKKFLSIKVIKIVFDSKHLHCFVQVHFKISMNMHQSKGI